MTLSKQLADQFREVQLNGTWVVATNLKAQLTDVSWEEATTRIGSLNTIAALTFHLNYYVAGLIRVLEGGPLDIRDKYSFDMPPITSAADWDALREKCFREAERFAGLVAAMPEEQLMGPFIMEQYGTYFRNVQVMIEHSYYHLGQIVLLRKLIKEGITG
jgi:uncharacterized damage-inducible protein DinB